MYVYKVLAFLAQMAGEHNIFVCKYISILTYWYAGVC